MPVLCRGGRSRHIVAGAALPLLLAVASAGAPTRRPEVIGPLLDSAAVVAVVSQFHQRLAQGDTAGVLGLLTPEALIFEGGAVETREQYRSHHLPADVEFLRAVKLSHTVRRAVTRGEPAWVGSTSEGQGTFRGRQLDLVGAELVVLERRGSQWQIAAVHWSSRSRGDR